MNEYVTVGLEKQNEMLKRFINAQSAFINHLLHNYVPEDKRAEAIRFMEVVTFDALNN